MSGRQSKQKGAAGERQALQWFVERWGDEIGPLKRNLEQTRSGGSDCLDLPGIALEVKRVEQTSPKLIDEWWIQTTTAAINADRYPVLMHRKNRQRWSFCIPSNQIIPGSWGYVTLTEPEFVKWFTQWLKKCGLIALYPYNDN